MHTIDETDITTVHGQPVNYPIGNTVHIRVLEERHDGTVRALVESCGISLRQGATITAPASAVQRRR